MLFNVVTEAVNALKAFSLLKLDEIDRIEALRLSILKTAFSGEMGV